MEFSLDLFIKKEDIERLGLSEILVYWGNESFSQNPPKYSFNSELSFEKNINNEIFRRYYYRTIDENMSFDGYIGLRLLGDTILDLEKIVNGNEYENINDKLILFLKKLYILPRFIIFLMKNGDEIDTQIHINSEKELINVVCDSLDWSTSSGGVLIIKQ